MTILLPSMRAVPKKTGGTVVCQMSGDTEIDSFNATTNYGSATTVRLHPESFAPHHGLLIPDISGVPGGISLVSGVLSLKFTAHAVNGTIHLYRVYRAWVEAQATWNIFSTGNNWGTPGCDNVASDRTATELGSASITGTGWLDFALSLAELASLLSSNHGILLTKTVSSSYDYSTFASLQDATPGNRPYLTIVYN